jgi:hypothetical protein
VTLVQTLLTPTGVIQVSDRQLTTPDGKPDENPANKAVIWCDHMVVGFSGMAFTDTSCQRSISEWIATALSDAVTVGDAALTLQQAGNELMAYTDIQRKRLTMVLAGASAENQNLILRISNVEHPGLAARSHFDVKTMHIPLHQGQYRYHTTGVLINPRYQQSYERELGRIHSNFGANHAAKSMIALQRRVRNEQLRTLRGTWVGEAAMVVWLPAIAEPKQVTLIITGTESADIDERWPMYSFVAAHGFSRVRFTPHFVCRGAVRIDPTSWASPGGSSTGMGQWSHIQGWRGGNT